jgi:hypothetical protein
MATKVKPCERCAVLEDWIRKALQLFDMIVNEWPGTTWLVRQVARAKTQCPVGIPTEEEHP